jgi:hypothetical protein
LSIIPEMYWYIKIKSFQYHTVCIAFQIIKMQHLSADV